MTENELIDALFALSESGDASGAYTTREICLQTGKSPRWVLEKLGKLHEQGRIEAVKKEKFAIDGRVSICSAYRVKNDP